MAGEANGRAGDDETEQHTVADKADGNGHDEVICISFLARPAVEPAMSSNGTI